MASGCLLGTCKYCDELVWEDENYKYEGMDIFHIECANKVPTTTQELNAIRQHLKEIEWVVERGETEMEYWCNACGGKKFYGGHKPTCWLDQEIKKLGRVVHARESFGIWCYGTGINM